jgi:hypothetical protein
MDNAFITLPKIGNGIFTADPDGRSKFANGFVNANLLTTDAIINNLPSGAVIQSQSASFKTYGSTTAEFPTTTSIPTNTQGLQLLAVTITPLLSSSKIRIRFHGYYGAPNSTPAISTAVFFDSEANAISTTSWYFANTGHLGTHYLETEHSPGSTSPHTYTIRIGTTLGTLWINGNPTNRLFGGTAQSYLVLEEIKA